MFMYDKNKKCLNVYNIDHERPDDEVYVYAFQDLHAERLVTQVPNFDYSVNTKYFMDQEKLKYAWKGNLIEYNLITNETNHFQLERQVKDG